jgi:xylan alpha-glucuronosyltransferase
MGVTTAGEAVKSPTAGVRAGFMVKLNAACLAFFLFAYMALLLHPRYSYLLDRSAASLVRCTFRDACPSDQLSRKVR